MKMKMYTNALAPSPRRANLFLAEKNLAMATCEIDIIRGENLTPEFLAINPLGELPVLVLDDGEVITETAAICRYLEDLHPSPPLFGGDDARMRLRVDMWTRRLEWQLLRRIYDAYWFGHPASRQKEKIPAAAEFAAVRAREYLVSLDKALAAREFIAGDSYTFADITLLAGLDFARVVAIRPADDMAALSQWLDKARARPATQSAASYSNKKK